VKRRCVIEEAVGETRAAIYVGGQLCELYVQRWSDAGKPRAGDVFCGRIRAVDKGLAAAFVDLGSGPDGLLKFANAPGAPRFKEGQNLIVSVSRETEAGKGPVLKFNRMSEGDPVGRLSGMNFTEFITARFGKGCKFETAAVSSIDDAVETELAIPGGGTIAIEHTRALVAIDIDKGAAQSGYAVCLSASQLIAQQLRLRGIGGLIVIDFPNLRQAKQREGLIRALEEAFSDDPNTVKIGGLSRFGLVELTRSKPRASLDEVLNDKYGRPWPQTQALRGLRRLEREARKNGGAQLTLTLPHEAYDWLQAEHIDWRLAMKDRIGARFIVQPGIMTDVKADR